jgi:putative ABC transport system permease protein
MFDLDQWREIFETLRGIENGVEHNFRDDAVNSIWIYQGVTSKPHAGYGIGRPVKFDNSDYDTLLSTIEEIDNATGRFYLKGEFTVRYGREVSSFEVRACHPGHRYIENTIITAGRFINDADLRDRRKVTVIGPQVVKQLFGRRDPLGKWIEVSGTPYRVVGTFDDEGWESEKSKIYVPITTAQTAYGGGDSVHQIMFTVGDASPEDAARIADETVALFAGRHHFALDDKRAVRVRNNVESFAKITSLFTSIRLFIWIVGIGTILAGIIGVSNIMLIAVRERTKEIGIRKALGATPRTIVRQIVVESLVITASSGYVGLLAGLGAVELANKYVPPSDYFMNPEANMTVVVSATVLLVMSGLLAAYFPARLAARINPVEALRAE